MGPVCYPETSVGNHHFEVRKIPKERRSHLDPSGILKSLLLLPCVFLSMFFSAILKYYRPSFSFLYPTVTCYLADAKKSRILEFPGINPMLHF